MHNYHSSMGTFTPGRYGCCFGTWQVFVLPYMEQNAVYNAYNQGNQSMSSAIGKTFRYAGAINATVASQRLNAFTCPSDIPTGSGTITYHNYAVNYGTPTPPRT